MKYFAIFSLLFCAMTINSQKKTIIYVGDPMCSWCYGFSPELDKIRKAFPNTPMEMVMGGLRAGGTQKINELKSFLSEHWADVENASGQTFNHDILNDSDITYDTEPACRAVWTAQHFHPNEAYDFFKRIQVAFYFDNKNPTEIDTYKLMASQYGWDEELFLKRMNSHEARSATQSMFDYAGQLGARGFPTLIAQVDEQFFIVTRGYQKADKLIDFLKMKGFD